MLTGPANTSGRVDETFLYIVGISVILLVLVTACMIYFVIRYNRKRHPQAEQVKENVWLEIFWTVVPTVLALSMFYFGWINFKYIRTPVGDAISINVVASKWSWLFIYESGKRSDVLRVPVNRPVRLVLTSTDVIHSMYIPAFRIKEDCVPGIKTYLAFTANETGSYDIFCTEYCGVGHSQMLSKVIVTTPEEFGRWYEASDASGVSKKGQALFRDKGCAGCHSIDGSRKAGPSFKGLYGSLETVITNGRERTVTVDGAYIKNYVRHPNVDIVKGYQPIMPVIPATDEEIEQLVEYIKTLK